MAAMMSQAFLPAATIVLGRRISSKSRQRPVDRETFSGGGLALVPFVATADQSTAFDTPVSSGFASRAAATAILSVTSSHGWMPTPLVQR